MAKTSRHRRSRKRQLDGAAIPNRGYCIGSHNYTARSYGGGYEACFPAGRGKAQAVRAARRLANKLRTPVDVVKVSNHGNDRHIVKEILPKDW